jgi:septal ring factor EnvC (AmiA/AmiB activator)
MSKLKLVSLLIALLVVSTPGRLGAQIPSTGISTAPSASSLDAQAAASASIPVLTADSAAAAALAAEYARQIADAKAKIDALNQQIKQLNAQIQELKDQIAKLETMIAKLEALKAKMETEIKDAKSSLSMMRRIVNDRTAAQRLLDAMKQRNVTLLTQLLDPSSSAASIVSVDVLSPEAIKMIFKIGALTQCIATRSVCGTVKYSIVK